MLSTEAQSCLFIFYGGGGVTDLASRSSDVRGLLSCTVPPWWYSQGDMPVAVPDTFVNQLWLKPKSREGGGGGNGKPKLSSGRRCSHYGCPHTTSDHT